MATYAAALAYRGLFGLLPFVFIVVVLVGALGFPDFFGVAVALWSVSAVARILTEAFNVAYQVAETRRWWKQLALSLAFGPILALVVIISVALMLVGTRLVERIAELVGLDELFVHLWGWLRFPAALFAGRSALGRLPLRSQRRATLPLPVGGTWRGALRGAVGGLLGRFFLLSGQLRRLRPHLR